VLSIAKTFERGNAYDTGYLVHATTGEVRTYHVW
jgi:hypothetical protein